MHWAKVVPSNGGRVNGSNEEKHQCMKKWLANYSEQIPRSDNEKYACKMHQVYRVNDLTTIAHGQARC